MTSPISSAISISQLAHGIDVLEESVRSLDRELLDILLYDRTTRTNILWGTTDYVSCGPEFGEFCVIMPELVTGTFSILKTALPGRSLQNRSHLTAARRAGRNTLTRSGWRSPVERPLTLSAAMIR